MPPFTILYVLLALENAITLNLYTSDKCTNSTVFMIQEQTCSSPDCNNESESKLDGHLA